MYLLSCLVFECVFCMCFISSNCNAFTGPVINPPKDFLHDETRKDVMNYMDAPLDTPKLQDGHRPEQIHIALGSKPSEMVRTLIQNLWFHLSSLFPSYKS